MSTTLDIVRIPVLNDNYVWLLREPQSGSHLRTLQSWTLPDSQHMCGGA